VAISTLLELLGGVGRIPEAGDVLREDRLAETIRREYTKWRNLLVWSSEKQKIVVRRSPR
jgi:hypothetical protein